MTVLSSESIVFSYDVCVGLKKDINMINDLNKFLNGVRILAQEVQEFLNRDEVKILAKKSCKGNTIIRRVFSKFLYI